MDGRVESILIAPDGAAAVEGVDWVEAVEGKGLVGDRYFLGSGTFSDNPGTGRHVTLIEREAIDAVRAEEGLDLQASATRRNIVTTGVALNHLVGRVFEIGEVRLRGMRLCEPCAHMSQLAGLNLTLPMLHRAGLRAEIVNGGVIHVGDRIAPIADG